MATGDQADFVSRLRSALPARWFPTAAPGAASATPILDVVLSGLASAWSGLYAQLSYAAIQTRIQTSTGGFLDLAALDFFGASEARRSNEADDPFRTRILRDLLRPRVTRAAMVKALTDLTGRAPVIFEPNNPTDTGGLATAGSGVWTGLALNAAGGLGCRIMPFEFFVKAYRPLASLAGAAGIAGLNTTVGGLGAPGLALVSASMEQSQISDADIYAEVAKTAPCASIAWTHISS